MRIASIFFLLTAVAAAAPVRSPREPATPSVPDVSGYWLGGSQIEQEGQRLHVERYGECAEGYILANGTVILYWFCEDECRGISMLRLEADGAMRGAFCPIVDGALQLDPWPCTMWRSEVYDCWAQGWRCR